MNRHFSNALANVFIEIRLITFTFIVLYVTYYKWKPNFFLGDDLSLLFLYRKNLFATGFTNVVSGIEHAYDKYRPVFVLLLSLEFDIFGEDLYKYFLFNIFIVSLSIWIISKIFRRMVPNLPRDAFILVLALISTSRFLTYQITQVLGTLEHSSQLLILSSVYLVNYEKHTKEQSRTISLRYGLWSVVFCFGGVLIHERYLVTFIFLGVVFWNRAKIIDHQRNILVIIAAVSFCISLFGRSWISGIPTFVGTSGQQMSINISDILDNSMQAILSIWGLNWGPEHLIGVRFTEIGIYVYVHIFTIIATIITICFYRRELWKNGLPLDIMELMFLSAILLIPPILTFRMEQRWEYFSFVIFILVITSVSSKIGKTVLWWISRAYFVSQLIINCLYMNEFGNIYMIYASNIAGKYHEFIVSSPETSINNIYFVSGKEHCEWTFQTKDFALLYINVPINPKCLNPQDIDTILDTSAKFLILDKSKRLVSFSKESINKYKIYIIPMQPGNVYQILIPDRVNG